MKKNTTVKQLIIIMLLAIITMVLSSCGNTSIETTTIEETTTLVNNDVKPTTFRFAAYRSGVIGEAEIYYDDSYFNIPATTLSNELTSASICLAVTGFSVVRGNDYTQSPKYAEALLTKLGFSNFESNEYGKTRPTSNSFGVYFGMKMVDDYTLIAVTTRGSNYGWEWASNLTIGEDGDFATGFYEASTIYINSLKDYISSKNITGKIKIWTAGYSRAAATVNLAIGRVDEALIENNHILGENVTYGIDDIYAYTYEAPRGRIGTVVDEKIVEKGPNYSNIHNFINQNDFITLYGFREHGFVRYGVDHYLPDPSNSIDYASHVACIKEIISKYNLERCASAYIIDDFKYDDSSSSTYIKYNWTLGKYVESLIDELAVGMSGREELSNAFDPFFNEFFSYIYANNAPSDNLYIFFNSIKNKVSIDEIMDIAKRNLYGLNSKMWTELKPVIDDAIDGTCIEEMGSDKIIELLKFIYNAALNTTKLKEGLANLPTLQNGTNLNAMICAHYPEINLANVLAMDDRYHTKSNTAISVTGYYTLVVNTQTPFKIISSKNNKTIFTLLSSNNSILSNLVIEKYNSGYTIYLPGDSEYTIECGEELTGILYYIGSDYLKEIKIDNSKGILKGNINIV